jgi:acid phosphatase (class A)
MFLRGLVLVALTVRLVSPDISIAAPVPVAPVAAADIVEPLSYLDAAEFAPDRLVPPPPVAGSAEEERELADLRAIIAAATPERLVQAQSDGDHEDPTVFSPIIGRDLSRLPATMALLVIVQQEAERVIDAAKLNFARVRPYGIDPALPHCGSGSNVNKSYPSGHAGFGWSVGWTLARLLPEQASAVLARAHDYGISRELCGVHFASDLEASHVIGVLVSERLLSDPRLSVQIAAARAELQAH